MKNALIAVMSGVLPIVVIWEVARFFAGSELLPSPYAVANLLVSSRNDLLYAGGRTAACATAGLAIATVVGTAVVSAVGIYPQLEKGILPLLVVLKASPAVAFAPVLLVFLQSGPQMKIAVSAMICFFPIIVAGLDGIRMMPTRLRVMADGYGARRVSLFRNITGGFALAGIVSGLKTAAPLSVVGAIVGEFVDGSTAGHGGIGAFINAHARDLYMTHVFAGVIVSTSLGILFYYCCDFIAHVVFRGLNLEKQN